MATAPRASAKSPNTSSHAAPDASLCTLRALCDLRVKIPTFSSANSPMKAKPHTRLDLALVERGLADSQQKAQAMILAGEVRVNGLPVQKAGMPVVNDAPIEVKSRQSKYASRGGLKLEGALEDFSINPVGFVCLDVGSSTGGFIDCLLQHAAARVYAVDVNISQLAWKLQQDPRVTAMERNARNLKPGDVPELVDI